ncbi:DgyrCDS8509 [Dimorphilus gyrociliatus]|uniref:DgyrCDS8509 n=1 Tax=Dimorphilus gyrociliatus TaxID=2664684 RepID=A0A7I8VUC4_9ANNE|nr:DgyrCDS8509 [Dimorphilus gyrociliatus]
MSGTLACLEHLTFPHSMQTALQHMEEWLSNGRVPGINISSEEFMKQICDDYVFSTKSKKNPKSQLTGLQELFLVTKLAKAFSKRGSHESIRQELFWTLFPPSHMTPQRQQVLTKVIGIGIAEKVVEVLEFGARFINASGPTSPSSQYIIQHTIDDYVNLFPNNPSLQNIHYESELFTCSFLCTCSQILKPPRKIEKNFDIEKKELTLDILKITSNWLYSKPTIGIASLPKQEGALLPPDPNCKSPTPVVGLIMWICKAALICYPQQLSNEWKKYYSRLRKGICGCLWEFKKLKGSEQAPLIANTDVIHMAKDLSKMCNELQLRNECIVIETVDVFLDFLDVAIGSLTVRASPNEIREVLQSLPSTISVKKSSIKLLPKDMYFKSAGLGDDSEEELEEQMDYY